MSLKRLPHPLLLPSSLRAYNHPRIRLIQLQQQFQRHASSSSNSPGNLKPLVLEKPDKFRPPSHSARRVTRQPKNFGPALTEQEIAAQKTKRYPHMFPPEGSFMFKFLTDRAIHLWISLSVLLSLTFYMFLTDFRTKNKYPEMLPPGSLFFTRPFSYLSQWLQVYKLHTEAVSAETADKRQRQIDEVRKRREYLRAHGLEKEGFLGLGTVEGDEYRRRKEEAVRGVVEGVGVEGREEEGKSGFRDFEGEVKRKPIKKWFGIW